MDGPWEGTILDVTPGENEGFERYLLEGMGHRVDVCRGSDGHGGCPMVEHGTCSKVDDAIGVVFKLDLDDEYHRRILDCYKTSLPEGMPLAVAVGPGQDAKYAALLEGVYVWHHSPTSADLDGFAALVEANVRGSATPVPDP